MTDVTKQVVTVALRLPYAALELAAQDAKDQNVSLATVVRNLVMAHYGLEEEAVAPAAPVVEGDVARIELSQGREALIDADLLDVVGAHTWHFWQGHAARTLPAADGGGKLYLERAVLGLEQTDPWRITFLNGNRLDCRRANLAKAPDLRRLAASQGAPPEPSGIWG
jgi:hypothetical protein